MIPIMPEPDWIAFTAVKCFRRMPIWLFHCTGKTNSHFWRGHSKGTVLMSGIDAQAMLPGRWYAKATFTRVNPYLVILDGTGPTRHQIYERIRFDIFEDWNYDECPDWICWLRDECLWIINRLMGDRMEERERRRNVT